MDEPDTEGEVQATLVEQRRYRVPMTTSHPAAKAGSSHWEAGHAPRGTTFAGLLGKYAAPWAHALFGFLSDVLRGQISKAGMTKELVIELQES